MIAFCPRGAEEICPGVRKRPLRQVRYSVLYAIEPGSVLVLALACQRRRPGYWGNRLPDRGEPGRE